jgi:dTMP kinase
MFVVFEGIDGSGKSTLSKAFYEEMLKRQIVSSLTKEPTFTSEQANDLNLKSKDDIGREIEFCIDRIQHQEFLKEQTNANNILICDRYIWSGLTYSAMFNPSAFEFAKQMYKHNFFIKPDYYVFVDTSIEICYERRQEQTIEQLTKLRHFYLETKKFVEDKSKILTISCVGDINSICLSLISSFHI